MITFFGAVLRLTRSYLSQPIGKPLAHYCLDIVILQDRCLLGRPEDSRNKDNQAENQMLQFYAYLPGGKNSLNRSGVASE